MKHDSKLLPLVRMIAWLVFVYYSSRGKRGSLPGPMWNAWPQTYWNQRCRSWPPWCKLLVHFLYFFKKVSHKIWSDISSIAEYNTRRLEVTLCHKMYHIYLFSLVVFWNNSSVHSTVYVKVQCINISLKCAKMYLSTRKSKFCRISS